MINDFKKAGYFVWIILSIFIAYILISPFIFSRTEINNIAPKCESKIKYGKECFFCGMTGAFIDISEGKIKDAIAKNNFSMSLFSIFILNEIILLFFSLRKLKSKVFISAEKNFPSVIKHQPKETFCKVFINYYK